MYDRVDSEAMWNILQLFWCKSKNLECNKCFYNERKNCVSMRNELYEWFLNLIGQCVMSPWLFNLNRDGVVREANIKVCSRDLELSEDGES